MSTPLYERILAFNYEDTDRAELMRKVWIGTPWVIDSYTGNYDEGRKRDMLHWCYETFGQQASPIHDRPGTWQQGSATIYGWTWFGFATKSQMHLFVERWPTPEGIAHPDAPALALQVRATTENVGD
jgi:hypothetical protein